MVQAVIAYVLVAGAGAWTIRGVIQANALRLKPAKIRPAKACGDGACDCGR